MNTSTLHPSPATIGLPVRQAMAPHSLSGGCFALLLALGLLGNVYSWVEDKLKLLGPASTWPSLIDGQWIHKAAEAVTAAPAPDGAAKPVPSWASWWKGDFMTGRLMQKFPDQIAHTPLPATAAQRERELSWLLLGDMGHRVRGGDKGWLFLADELTPHPDAAADAARRASEVITLHQRLAAQGVELLVAVVPDKSRIEAEHLGLLRRPDAFEGRVRQWTAMLAQAGVHAVDLGDALAATRRQGKQAFLRTDSHWTEEGAEAAAAQIAQRSLPLRAGIAGDGAGLEMSTRTQMPRPGDLVRLAGLDGLPLWLQPKVESAQQSRFQALRAPASANDDLFGDAALPSVALIGSSFSRTSNFAPFLALQLRAQVANFALDGGDFSGAARAYLASQAFRQTPPKLLIWEIPERVLSSGRKDDHLP